MRSSFSKIKGKEVVTTSGLHLGKVRDVIFDMNTQMVVQYEVSKLPFPEFFGEKKHLVNHKQVAAFKEEAIIVKDARLSTPDKKSSADSDPAVMTDQTNLNSKDNSFNS